MIDSLFLLIFRFLSNVRNLNQCTCSILFTVGLIILAKVPKQKISLQVISTRWYLFLDILQMTKSYE